MAAQIRPMVIADYDAVHALWTETAGIGLRDIDDSRNGVERFLRRNPGTSCVACMDDHLIGAVLCGHDGHRGYIYHAGVAQSFRGQGIGRSLVERAINALGRAGISKAALVVFKDNAAGNEFWEILGFRKRDDLFYRDMFVASP